MARKKQIAHHPAVLAFAKRLREVRHRRGLSQMDLALQAKVTPSYIGKLERAEAAPGLDMVARLAETLGVGLSVLVGEQAQRPPPIEAMRRQLQRKVDLLSDQEDLPAVEALTLVVAMVAESAARKRR